MELGDKRWQARHTLEGLQLSRVETTDDTAEQASIRRVDIANEVKMRKGDMERLSVQQGLLAVECEEVPNAGLWKGYAMEGL